MEKALYHSYQAAVVQTFNAKNNTAIKKITSIITHIQDNKSLEEEEKKYLTQLGGGYANVQAALVTNDMDKLIKALTDVIEDKKGKYFRALINHDKLKVDYEDKIISIPYMAVPLDDIDPPVDGGGERIFTNFHNGTVFKWVHGNNEEWVPDTYWIVYMQYSEETAYFRGEIRRADEEIIVIDSDGNQHVYQGWMKGPDETQIVWNVKKNVVWNDMFYTKLLFISKDEDTLAFFKRFDRVKINGQDWEIQAYNDNYGTSAANQNTGIIRVALKETYTNTDDMIKEELEEKQEQKEKEKEDTTPRIIGPTEVYPYDKHVYELLHDAAGGTWSVSDPKLARITAQNNNKCMIEIIATKGSKTGFTISCGSYNFVIPKILSL